MSFKLVEKMFVSLSLDAIFYDGKYYIQVGNYAEMYNKVNYYMVQNSCFTFYCMISSKD